jgi:hypothetical protein
LLTQAVQHRELILPLLVAINGNIVAHGIRREESDHRARREPFLGDDLLQHLLRVLIERARRLPHFVILQNRREAPLQIPCREKRRPVDQPHKLAQIVMIELLGTEERRLWRRVSGKVGRETLRPRIGERQPLRIVLSACMGFRNARIFLAHLRERPRANFRIDQTRNDAHRPACIDHVHRLATAIARRNFHGRMHLARGGTADQ